MNFYITAYIEWLIQITVDTYRHCAHKKRELEGETELENGILYEHKLIKL